MRLRISCLIVMLLSWPTLGQSLSVNGTHVTTLETVSVDVFNDTVNAASVKIVNPDGEMKTLAVIMPSKKSILRFHPSIVGKYEVVFLSQTHELWAHKKPVIAIEMSSVFVPNIPVIFTIQPKYLNKNLNYEWQIFLDNSLLKIDNTTQLSFTPLTKGDYSLKLKVSDNRVPNNSLSTTTVYRTFKVKDRIDSFRMNIPSVVYASELPFKAEVIGPLNSDFKSRWFIGKNDTPFETLSINKDMFVNGSLRVTAKVYKDSVIVGEKSMIINFEESRLKSGYISVRELPSGNIEISSDGDGYLYIGDKDVLANKLIVSDSYIVIKPLHNHSFDILLKDKDLILDEFTFNNTIEFYSYNFDVTFLTDNNVTPSFINFKINNNNIPAEKIESINFYLNEQLMPSDNMEANAYSDLLGINTARIELTLKTGEIIIKAKKFTLSSSTSPVCNLEYDNLTLEVWARCTDTDSFVKDYTYTLAKSPISNRNSLILPENYINEIIVFEAVDALGNVGNWQFKIVEGAIVYVQ